jgi:hypothetical protein
VNYDLEMHPQSGTLVSKYSTYEDSGIRFMWSWEPFEGSTGYAPNLEIKNNSPRTIKVLWSDCVIVEGGSPYPIYDTLTVAPEETTIALPNSVIPSESKTNFVIARKDNVYDRLNVALALPILAGTGERVKVAGDTMIIYMVLEVDGNRKSYDFVFTVVEVD